MARTVKNLLAMQKTQVQSLDWEDLLEKGASLVAQMILNLPAMRVCETGSTPGSERSPGEGNGNRTPVYLPGEFHGQRRLAGCSPWDCRHNALMYKAVKGLSRGHLFARMLALFMKTRLLESASTSQVLIKCFT